MMTLSEKLMNRIQSLNDNLTLKDDYSDELEELDSVESDASVARYMGAPVWKIQDILKEIKNTRAWIKEEMQSRA